MYAIVCDVCGAGTSFLMSDKVNSICWRDLINGCMHTFMPTIIFLKHHKWQHARCVAACNVYYD